QLPHEPTVYTVLLYTKKTDIIINEDVFPTDKRTSWSLVVDSPSCTKTYDSNPNGTVDLYIEMDCEFPLINGTFWIMKITFTKCDPWFCGRQPNYTRIDHEWRLETGETDIWFHDGYFSVYCPDYTYMLFGTHVDIVGAHYTFKPIPGDLDGSGHVDIVDLCIIAGYYGKGNSYYDLNRDGIIDVFDIVVVAKNFCRTKP
ncbi:MAG: dockerin type I domain-containing protein, partial [Candidatus Bathyarchaeia archaeon]|nr:dockerin type I domain-containing protein [Candidatus Bathyarchaeia archaeon]